MFSSIIIGIVLIALGLVPVYTSLSLWWLFLGVPLILIGLVFFVHANSLRRTWDRVLTGEGDMKELTERINKNLKVK